MDHTGRTYLGSHLESKSGWRVKHLVYALLRPGQPRLYVSRKLVHDRALSLLRAVATHPEALRQALADYRDRQEAVTAAGTVVSRESLATRLERLRRQMDDLLRRELEAEDAEERASVARVREAKKQEIHDTQARLEALLRSPDPTLNLDWLVNEHVALLGSFDAVWQEYTEAERRQLTGSVIDHIEVLIEPVLGQRAFRREIVSTAYQPWLASYMSKRNST